MRTSELQRGILTELLDGRVDGSTFLQVYDALGKPTTIQAFGRSIQACFRRGWVNELVLEDGSRELAITPEGELAFGGGVLSPQVDRESWKVVRGPYIGSSDVAAVFGLHEYGIGPWDVWDRIVLGKWNEPGKVGADIRRGNRHEPDAMQRFFEVYGLEARSQSMVHHPRWHYLVSDPDQMILPTKDWPEELRANPLWARVIEISESGKELVHEVKCPRTSIFYEARDLGLRTEYAIQMQHHLLCTGAEGGVFTLYDAQYDDVQSFPVVRFGKFIDELEVGLPQWYERHVIGRSRPTRPLPQPPVWPSKIGGDAVEITDGKQRDQVELVKIRERELLEATEASNDTKQALLDMMPKEGRKFVGDGVKVERKSSPQRRQFDKKGFVAAITLAQQDGDVDALMTIDANDDRFYYLTGGTDKEEVTVFGKTDDAHE